MLKDAFICHASEDKRLARSVWIRLSQYGVTAWLDEAEMSAGDILVQKIATAIHTSHWFIALLTPTSVTKKWVRFELNQAMDREIREGRTFIIPVVADDCEIPVRSPRTCVTSCISISATEPITIRESRL
jgi:hypothetical protein